MTSIPATPRPQTGLAPRPSGPAPGAGVSTVDPIKMFRKYKWVLVIAGVLGVFLGVGAHFVWMATYPIYRPRVIFQCFNVMVDPTTPAEAGQVDDVALDRFMQTQRAVMLSDLVLQKVAEDRRLQTEAPRWASGFMENGVFNPAEAARELNDITTARVLPQTRFIEMSIGWKDRTEATAILKLWRENYEIELRRQSQEASRSQREAVTRAITEFSEQADQAQGRRRRLMSERNVDVITRQSTETQQRLTTIGQQLVNIRLDLEALRTRQKSFEEELQNPGGPQYSESLRDEVESSPEVLNIKNVITTLESERQAMTLRITPEHRNVKEIDTQLEGYRKSLETKRTELLDQRFRAQIDTTRTGVMQLEAQDADLTRSQEELSQRLEELTQTQAELDDIDRTVGLLIENKSKLELDLRKLNAIQSLDSFVRVQVFQREAVPNEVSFPKIQVMLPAGVLLTVFLVTAFLVGKELLDTRIKGPSDVALIPRARVLGLIPSASEDPSAPGAVETAFRDRPKGVVAESFRQVRSTLTKRMDLAAHRTLVVISAKPGSGSTSVISNLALVGAAAGQRVLVIDANMRRPSFHRIFSVNETPGLCDVVLGNSKLEGAIQRGGDDRLHVLTAGSKEHRGGELLATESMTKLLRQAREMYDMVLIDVPPALVSGDGVAVANRCDASMLVVRAMNETRGMVARLVGELNDCRGEMLGVLVNGVKSSAGGYLRDNIKATHDYLNG
jgi:polysaccharide biosynthesis transport protein